MFPVRARLVQKLAVVVVNVGPQVQLPTAVSQLYRFFKRLAVFREGAARGCEGVDWIESYYSKLALRCLHLHCLLPFEFCLSYPTYSLHLQLLSSQKLRLSFKIILTFSFLRASVYIEGRSR